MGSGKELDDKWKAGFPTAKVKDKGDEQYAASCPKCHDEIYVISPGWRGPTKCKCGEVINLTSLWGKPG